MWARINVRHVHIPQRGASNSYDPVSCLTNIIKCLLSGLYGSLACSSNCYHPQSDSPALVSRIAKRPIMKTVSGFWVRVCTCVCHKHRRCSRKQIQQSLAGSQEVPVMVWHWASLLSSIFPFNLYFSS